MNKDVFKDVFKSEEKEVERKRKRNKMWGEGLIVNIFFGVEIFSSGVVIFSGVLRNFRGGGVKKKIFDGRVEKFSGGVG